MSGCTLYAASAIVDGRRIEDVRFDVDERGVIVRADERERLQGHPEASRRRALGNVMVLPGFVNAHSHAFQRAIRGATHHRGADDPSSFWSWREAMYRAAAGLDPDAFEDVTRRAFAEMREAGITCVGEFHYVHHQRDGRPYDDPNELSHRVIRAAESVGIRLVLLEVYYARAGHGAPPLPEQRRFCDGSVQAYLQRVDALRRRGTAVGITPHSIRAAGMDDLRELCAYATEHDLVVHTHLSEQPRENEECLAEHGVSPTLVFAEAGALDRPGRFTAVHAVHVTDEDRRTLSGQNVCACPTTEADLGDGIVGASRLRRAGVSLSLGSDSNSVIDLIQEARALEMHERLASQERLRLNDERGRLGEALLDIATRGGARALGVQTKQGTLAPGFVMDAALVDLEHPLLAGVSPDHLLDAIFTGATASLVCGTLVGGEERPTCST